MQFSTAAYDAVAYYLDNMVRTVRMAIEKASKSRPRFEYVFRVTFTYKKKTNYTRFNALINGL